MNNLYSKNSEIVPRKQIGGVELGLSIHDLKLEADTIKEVNEQKMVSILDGSIFILLVDNRVFQVSALAGYQGKLLNKHYIGESISNFIDSDSWEFSDADDGFINKECAGVVIRCDLEDASIEEIRENQSELYVAEISVFE